MYHLTPAASLPPPSLLQLVRSSVPSLSALPTESSTDRRPRPGAAALTVVLRSIERTTNAERKGKEEREKFHTCAPAPTETRGKHAALTVTVPPPLFSLHCARVTHSAAVSSRPERVCRCFVIARGKAPPPKEDGGGEQDQQRVRWYRGDKNGEGARVSGEPSPGSGRAEHAIAAGDLCTNSYRPTYRPATTTERPMGGRVACPPAFQTDAAAAASGRRRRKLSLSRYRGVPLCFLLPSRGCPAAAAAERVRAGERARPLLVVVGGGAVFLSPPPPQSIFPLPLPLPLSPPWFIRPLSLFGGGCLSERLPVRLSLSPLSRWSPLLSLSLFPARQLFSRGEGDGACFSPGGLQNNKRTRGEEGAWAEVE